MQITVTVKSADSATEGLGEAILLGTRNGLEKIGERGVGLVVKGTPVGATGNLASSMFAHLEQGGSLLTEIIAAGAPADVYAAPVETGTRPHFPPPDALIPWVVKKLGATDERTAREIAFAIARKIAARGTIGAEMFAQAFDVLQAEVLGILEREIAEACAAAGIGR